MAAETLTTTRAADDFPVVSPAPGGICQVVWGSYTLAANVEDGDIFEMCKLPAGATVIGGWIQAADLDTGTEALDMDIGWAANGVDAADPDGFGNLGVWTGDVSVHLPVAGNYFPLAGVLQSTGPKTFGADTMIQIEANAAAATGGTGVLNVVVFFTIS
jgi:hypothetical protein